MRPHGRMVVTVALTAGFGLIILASSVAQEAKPTITVLLTNIEFKPNRIKVKVGDTVKFINKDKFDHDVFMVRTANRNDVLHAATTLHSGQSVTITIDQEGLFTLYCTIHGGMTGRVTTTDTFELTEEEKKRAASRKVIPPIVKVGEELYWGRAQCYRCHMVGKRGDGLRGPNHQDLGFRAGARAKKFGLSSATEYITQSILQPSAHIVEGYTDDMPNVYQPPINLNADDIKALVAYLQSQGGEVDTWSIDINPQILATKLEPSPFRHGDPRRGERVFLDMGCGSCHTAGGRPGLSVAPDLSAIGAYRNWTWLGKSIVDPSAEVGANWKDATVYLKPGVKLTSNQAVFESDEDFDEDEESESEDATTDASSKASGELAQAREQLQKIRQRIQELEAKAGNTQPGEASLVREDSPSNSDQAVAAAAPGKPNDEPEENFEYGESVPGVLRKNGADEVVLLVAPDRYATFPRDQVAGVKLSKGSRMASNYGELMTYQQLSDLVSYLESLKGEPKANNKAQNNAATKSQAGSTPTGHR